MFKKTEVKMNKPRDGRHCDLCGCSFPAVRCDKCSSQIFCLSCDDMYHRHPKRKFHLRKAVDPTPTPQARPVLPLKVSNLGVAPGDPSKMPLPPPRKKKPGKSIFDSFRRGSPANDTSPTLPKKEYSWTNKLGNITKFMSNRPLPPVPDDNDDDASSVANTVPNHNLAFIHRKVDEKPPALPQRQPRSPQQSPFPTNGDNINSEPEMINGNAPGFSATLKHNTEENQKWAINPQMPKHLDGQGFGTLPPQSQLQDMLSRVPFKPTGMHQSSSASDLTALSDAPLGPSMQPYLPYFNPHFASPYPYPMYPQYPPYPQYTGNSWTNLSNPPSGNEQDLSDSESSSKKFNRGRFKNHMERKAKRSQSVMVDRMAYPGHFHPFAPYPPMYPGHPWMPGHSAEAPPPSPGPHRHSFSHSSNRKKKATDDEDDFDEFSSSPLSRPKSSSSEISKHKTRSKPKNYPSSSSSEHEREGESHVKPKASPSTKKKHFKQQTLKRKNSSPQQPHTTHKNEEVDQAEPVGLQMMQQVPTASDTSPEVPHADGDIAAEKISQLSVKSTESPVTEGTENNQKERPEENNQQLPSAGWQCKYCTYLNSPEERICQVCCKTACKHESPVGQDETKSPEQNESPDFTKSTPSTSIQQLQSSNVEIPGSPDRHDIAILNSALDEAEKQINESLEELLKVKEESAISEKKKKVSASKAVQDNKVNHSISSSSKSTDSPLANDIVQNVLSKELSGNVSSQKDTAVQYLSSLVNSSHDQVDNSNISFPSHASVLTSNGEQQKRDIAYGNDAATSQSEITSGEARKDSFCQTYQDVPSDFVPQNVGFLPMNSHGSSVLKSGHQPFERDFGQSTLPYGYYQPPLQDRGFGNGFNGMHRAHSRASLFGGRLSDAMPATHEYGGMGVGFGPPASSMIRSLSRASLLGESEGWGNEYPGRPKPDFYLSMEELVERRRQETMRAQGLELVQMIREAEQQGFTADDIQVALNNCGKQNPVKWLQDNWRNLIRTVVTLATNYGKDKRENDVGLVSDNEAKDALRLHKGNIWAAVTECVEGRQRKFLELSARGNFSFKEVLDALTDSEGDVELAYAKLTNTTLKPFLMRIWGSGEGVSNLEGAQPLSSLDRYSPSNKQNADDVLTGSERNDIETWEEEYGDDIEWEDDDVCNGNSENDEEHHEESVDLSSQDIASFKSDDLEKSEKYHTLTRDNILSPESDKSDYCDAFGSGLGDRYLSSTSIDEIYLIDADVEEGINFDSKSSIDGEEEDTRRKSTGFLNKLAALRKNSLFDKARKGESYSSKASEEKANEIKEQNDSSENANEPIPSTSDVPTNAVEEAQNSGFIQPLKALKQTFTALKDAVSGTSSKTGKSSPSIYNRRMIIVHGRIAHETMPSESPHDATSNTNSHTESSFENHTPFPSVNGLLGIDTKVSVGDNSVDTTDVSNSQSKAVENVMDEKKFGEADSKQAFVNDSFGSSSICTTQSEHKLPISDNDKKVATSDKISLVSELPGSEESHTLGILSKKEKYQFNDVSEKSIDSATKIPAEKEIICPGNVTPNKSHEYLSHESMLINSSENIVGSLSESMNLSEQINSDNFESTEKSKLSDTIELSESPKLQKCYSEVLQDSALTAFVNVNQGSKVEGISTSTNFVTEENLVPKEMVCKHPVKKKCSANLHLNEESKISVTSPEQGDKVIELLDKPSSSSVVDTFTNTFSNEVTKSTDELKTLVFEQKTEDLHFDELKHLMSEDVVHAEANKTAEIKNIQNINSVMMKDMQDIQPTEEKSEAKSEFNEMSESNEVLLKHVKETNSLEPKASESAKVPETSSILSESESKDESVNSEPSKIIKMSENTKIQKKLKRKEDLVKPEVIGISENNQALAKSECKEDVVKPSLVEMKVSEGFLKTGNKEELRKSEVEVTKISESKEYSKKLETSEITTQSENKQILVKRESEENSIKPKREDSTNAENGGDSINSDKKEVLVMSEKQENLVNSENEEISVKLESIEDPTKLEMKDITQRPEGNQIVPLGESKEDSIKPETSKIEEVSENAHFMKPESKEDSVKPGTSAGTINLSGSHILLNTENKNDPIKPQITEQTTRLGDEDVGKKKVKASQKKSKNKGLLKKNESNDDGTISENHDNLIKDKSINLQMKDEYSTQATNESSDLRKSEIDVSCMSEEDSRHEVTDVDKKLQDETVDLSEKTAIENITITAISEQESLKSARSITTENSKTSASLTSSSSVVDSSIEDAGGSVEQIKLVATEDLACSKDEKLGIVETDTVFKEPLSDTKLAHSKQIINEKMNELKQETEQEKLLQASHLDRDTLEADNRKSTSLQTYSSVESTSCVNELDKHQQSENAVGIISSISENTSNTSSSGQEKVDINQKENITGSSELESVSFSQSDKNKSVNNELNKTHVSVESELQKTLLHPVHTTVSPKPAQETTGASSYAGNSRKLFKNHDVLGDGKDKVASTVTGNVSTLSSRVSNELVQHQSSTSNADTNFVIGEHDGLGSIKEEEKGLISEERSESEAIDSAASTKHIPEAAVSEITASKDTLETKSDENVINVTSNKAASSSDAKNLSSIDEDSLKDISGNEEDMSLYPASPVRPVGHLRRMSFNTRREAIFRERNIDSTTTEFIPKKSEPFKPVYSKRSIKQQLEFERKVRKYVADRKCRTYRKAEIVVQLLELNFDETEAIYAANECSNLDQAISFLQQECQLCAGKYPVGEIISMVHCSHKACKECIKAYFTIQIRDRIITDLLCPFCNEPDITDEDVAQDYFNHLDIMLKKLVDVEIHELFQRKLRDRVLMKDPNFRWCSQCSSGFIADPYLKRLICPDCNAITCATCRRLWEREHEGVSCQAFAEWKDANDSESQTAGLAKLLTEDGIDCPSCHFRYALAKGGCMHFKCIQCQHDFCSGCSRPFRMGKKCGVSEFCVKLGLHAHHPRNCLFYLRDKEPEDLQRLLDMNGIVYNKGTPKSSEAKTLCDVMEQKETSHGMVDDICGKEVQEGYAGLCRIHFVEYLGQLVNKHKIDPIQIFDNDDLELVLKRASIRLPPKRYRESEADYREKLVQLIEERLPLGEVEGS